MKTFAFRQDFGHFKKFHRDQVTRYKTAVFSKTVRS